jgi:hypothetical protein
MTIPLPEDFQRGSTRIDLEFHPGLPLEKGGEFKEVEGVNTPKPGETEV